MTKELKQAINLRVGMMIGYIPNRPIEGKPVFEALISLIAGRTIDDSYIIEHKNGWLPSIKECQEYKLDKNRRYIIAALEELHLFPIISSRNRALLATFYLN